MGKLEACPTSESRRQELNLHPSVYRTVAQPIELHRRTKIVGRRIELRRPAYETEIRSSGPHIE